MAEVEAPPPAPPVPSVTKTTIETFLSKCISSMKSEETRALLKDPASGRPGAKLVEMQSKVWDELGVSQSEGRAAVNMVEQTFPNDAESLIELRKEFSKQAENVYLQCLEDRRPAELEKEGKLSRELVLEFFDACNVKMDSQELQEKIKEFVNENGCLPDELVNDMHQDVMRLLGVDPDHGKACFAELAKDFKGDREVAQSYQAWQRKADMDCLAVLREYQKNGGEVKAEDAVKGRLLEFQARAELDVMDPSERGELLEKNAKKVQIFRSLPQDGRKRHVEKLTDAEKLELAKCEILFVSYAQQQQQARAQAALQQQAMAEAAAKAKAEEAAAAEAVKKAEQADKAKKKKKGGKK